ncbi:MAG: hypothetical protein WCA07_17395 [Gloeobacterales cyanobacterium]
MSVIAIRRENFQILHSSFSIEGPVECLALLEKLLHPFWVVSKCAESFEVFIKRERETYYLQTPTLCHSGSCLEIVQFCEWWLFAEAVAVHTDGCQLHGGAVANEDGAILLLAPSGQGKTTLTLALMARGFTPFTDDIILLDRHTLAVRPFPRCFHVDANTTQVIQQLSFKEGYHMPSLECLEVENTLAEALHRPLQWATPQVPSLIVFPEYRPGVTLHLERLRPAQTWMRLINNLIVPHADVPSRFGTLRALVDRVQAYQMVHSDLDETITALERLLQGTSTLEEGA